MTLSYDEYCCVDSYNRAIPFTDAWWPSFSDGLIIGAIIIVAIIVACFLRPGR